jgi:hypothetical protein
MARYTRRLEVRLSPRLFDLLEAARLSTGRSKGALIRQILSAYFMGGRR